MVVMSPMLLFSGAIDQTSYETIVAEHVYGGQKLSAQLDGEVIQEEAVRNDHIECDKNIAIDCLQHGTTSFSDSENSDTHGSYSSCGAGGRLRDGHLMRFISRDIKHRETGHDAIINHFSFNRQSALT